MTTRDEAVEAWTHQAFEAAQSGRWDDVQECYRERDAALCEGVLSASLAFRLSAIDREIEARARAALAALSASLEEAAAVRQRLRRLREQLLFDHGTGRLANRRG